MSRRTDMHDRWILLELSCPATEKRSRVRISDFSGVDARSAGFIPQDHARGQGADHTSQRPAQERSCGLKSALPSRSARSPTILAASLASKSSGRDAGGSRSPENSEMRPARRTLPARLRDEIIASFQTAKSHQRSRDSLIGVASGKPGGAASRKAFATFRRC